MDALVRRGETTLRETMTLHCDFVHRVSAELEPDASDDSSVWRLGAEGLPPDLSARLVRVDNRWIVQGPCPEACP